MAATQRNIFRLIILIGLLSASNSSFAQSKDLDPEKWAIELSKKDRSSYDSLLSLKIRLQGVDSLQAFQFLDHLAEKRKIERRSFPGAL